MANKNNPTSRMKSKGKEDIKPKEVTPEMEVNDAEAIEALNEGMTEPVVENFDAPKEKEILTPEDLGGEYIKDLDIQGFFFTGKLQHTFDIKGLKVMFKLLSSEELLETHKILWEIASRDTSTDVITVEHSIEVLARAIMKYNNTDLESMLLEERKEFISKNIPGILLTVLINKYRIFEMSADKLFEDKDSLKN